MTSPDRPQFERCPHCGNAADIEADRLLRFRCRVCGGPRVPLDDPRVARAGSEREALAEAQRARSQRAAWAVLGGVVGGFGLLSLLVTMLVLGLASPGLGATLGLLGAVAVPLAFALFAVGRARRSRQRLDAALDSAWQAVAKEMMAERQQGLTVAELGALMRLGEPQAEQLLAALSVDDMVHSRVTDAGDVLYASGPVERLRVEDSAGGPAETDSADTAEQSLGPRPRP